MRPDILVVVGGGGGAVENACGRHLKYGYNVCKISWFSQAKMVSKCNRIASLVIFNYKIFMGEIPQTPYRKADVQYTKRGFTIFHVGFGVATLCLAQSRWFHGDGHREFQVNQRDSQRDEERGVIIDFREMGCFIATPCLFVSGREIPCLYVSEREIYDLLFTFAISAHGSKVQFTAYAQKPS